IDGDPTSATPLAAPLPEPMPGYFVPVAEPREGEAVASFHAALQALAEGRDPDGKVRVAMYGASGTAADISVGYVRTYLQARFGGPARGPAAGAKAGLLRARGRAAGGRGAGGVPRRAAGPGRGPRSRRQGARGHVRCLGHGRRHLGGLRAHVPAGPLR